MFVYHIPIKRPILQFSISSTLLFTRTSLTVCDAYPRLYKSLWCLLIALARNVMRSIVSILTAVRLILFYTAFTAYFPPPFEALVSTITAKRQLVAYTYKCRIPKLMTNTVTDEWLLLVRCVLSHVGGSEKSQLWFVLGGSEKNRRGNWNVRQAMLQQVFRVTIFCINTCFQSFSTLICRVVHHAVLKFSPRRNKPQPLNTSISIHVILL